MSKDEDIFMDQHMGEGELPPGLRGGGVPDIVPETGYARKEREDTEASLVSSTEEQQKEQVESVIEAASAQVETERNEGEQKVSTGGGTQEQLDDARRAGEDLFAKMKLAAEELRAAEETGSVPSPKEEKKQPSLEEMRKRMQTGLYGGGELFTRTVDDYKALKDLEEAGANVITIGEKGGEHRAAGYDEWDRKRLEIMATTHRSVLRAETGKLDFNEKEPPIGPAEADLMRKLLDEGEKLAVERDDNTVSLEYKLAAAIKHRNAAKYDGALNNNDEKAQKVLFWEGQVSAFVSALKAEEDYKGVGGNFPKLFINEEFEVASKGRETNESGSEEAETPRRSWIPSFLRKKKPKEDVGPELVPTVPAEKGETRAEKKNQAEGRKRKSARSARRGKTETSGGGTERE